MDNDPSRMTVRELASQLCEASLDYDAAIQRHAIKGESWVGGDDLDVLYEKWTGIARKLKESLLRSLPPPPPADEERIAKIVYAAMRKAVGYKTPKWFEGGNATAQDDARSAARKIVAELSSANAEEAEAEHWRDDDSPQAETGYGVCPPADAEAVRLAERLEVMTTHRAVNYYRIAAAMIRRLAGRGGVT